MTSAREGRLQERLAGRNPTIGVALESLDEVMMACVSLAGFAIDERPSSIIIGLD